MALQAVSIQASAPLALSLRGHNELLGKVSSSKGASRCAKLTLKAMAQQDEAASSVEAVPAVSMRTAMVGALAALAVGQLSVAPSQAAEMYEGRSDLPADVIKDGIAPGRSSPVSGPTDLNKNAQDAYKNSGKTFDRVFGRVKEAADDVKGNADQAASAAKGKAKGLVSKAPAAAAGNALSSLSANPLEGKANEALGAAKGVVGSAQGKVDGKLGSAKGAASDIKGKADDTASAAGGVSDVASQIQKSVEKITSSVGGLTN